jgi:hypothetical protein
MFMLKNPHKFLLNSPSEAALPSPQLNHARKLKACIDTTTETERETSQELVLTKPPTRPSKAQERREEIRTQAARLRSADDDLWPSTAPSSPRA